MYSHTRCSMSRTSHGSRFLVEKNNVVVERSVGIGHVGVPYSIVANATTCFVNDRFPALKGRAKFTRRSATVSFRFFTAIYFLSRPTTPVNTPAASVTPRSTAVTRNTEPQESDPTEATLSMPAAMKW